MEYPLVVESYGLVPGSGAGKHRGGLGAPRGAPGSAHDDLLGQGERFTESPLGHFGGHKAAEREKIR